MKRFGLTILVLCFVLPVYAQEKKLRENIDLKFLSRELIGVNGFTLRNVNGSVTVTGYDGDEIRITGTKEIWKENGTPIAEQFQAFYLEKVIRGDRAYLYMQGPGVHVDFDENNLNYYMDWEKGLSGNYKNIRFRFDLEVKVPYRLFIGASTINGGDVLLTEMRQGAFASNVNGNITIKEVKGHAKASTVNGDIEVWFSESPRADLQFNTVNGTIEVYSPKDLSAVVTFRSLHGDLYTDFEQVHRMPSRLDMQKDGNGYRYKINKTSPIRIGQGEIEMDLKIVNGNVYIRKRKS